MPRGLPLVIKAGTLASLSEGMRWSTRVVGEKTYATSLTEPFAWICANSTCRSEYLREPYGSEYCPTCNGHLRAGRGDLLDPVVYAACQKIIADECKADHKTQEWRDWVEDYSGYKPKPFPSPEAAWRALLGLPPLKSDEELNEDTDFLGRGAKTTRRRKAKRDE